MRQAGRYLPEYRALREKAGSFLDLCYNPKLAAEVTLQPLKRFDLDAAIIFADILVVPHAMGMHLEFAENEGPVLERIDSEERVAQLLSVEHAFQVDRVCETVARVKAAIEPETAIIGFCGAPWTVASYMIGGKGPQCREQARVIALQRPAWFAMLLDKLVASSIVYLNRQVEAGADALQIFDSWAGDLPYYAQKSLVAEAIGRIIAGVRETHPAIPFIVFAKGAGAGHRMIGEVTGAQAIGVESSLPLDWARETLIPRHAVQGNLDPILLETGGKVLDTGIGEIVTALPMQSHIFNLGHGIRPSTPPDHVSHTIARIRLADRVHRQ